MGILFGIISILLAIVGILISLYDIKNKKWRFPIKEKEVSEEEVIEYKLYLPDDDERRTGDLTWEEHNDYRRSRGQRPL